MINIIHHRVKKKRNWNVSQEAGREETIQMAACVCICLWYRRAGSLLDLTNWLWNWCFILFAFFV